MFFHSMNFSIGKYNWSAESYRKAFKYNKEIKMLFADALMYAGKYKEALDIFKNIEVH